MWEDRVTYWRWIGMENPTQTPTNKIHLRVTKTLFGFALCIGVIEPKKYTRVNRKDPCLYNRPIRSKIVLPLLDFYGICYSKLIAVKQTFRK